jgi:protein involved in polysaccharide export with SLBB domain
MNSFPAAVAAFVIFFLSSFAHAQSISPLRPGDSVQIELKPGSGRADVIRATCCVGADGAIKLAGLETPVLAEGLSITELARAVEAACQAAGVFPGYKPAVSLCNCGNRINQPPTVAVGGEVKNPKGDIPIKEGMTLYRAVLAAGGPTEFADLRRVKLIRGNTSTICDLRRHKEKEHNPTLKEGDSIHVPQN